AYDTDVDKTRLKMKLAEHQTPPAPIVLPPDPGAGSRGTGVVARGAVPGPGGAPGSTPFGGGPKVRSTSGRGSINGRMTFEGSAVMVSVLVNTLQQLLDRPVIEKTGLTGLFDIKLEWIPGEEAPPSPFSPNPDATPSPTGAR